MIGAGVACAQLGPLRVMCELPNFVNFVTMHFNRPVAMPSPIGPPVPPTSVALGRARPNAFRQARLPTPGRWSAAALAKESCKY